MHLDDLHLVAQRLRETRKKIGQHRTDNRTGHYTLDGVTRSLSHLVEHGPRWASPR